LPPQRPRVPLPRPRPEEDGIKEYHAPGLKTLAEDNVPNFETQVEAGRKNWPTADDVELSRKYDLSYGDPSARFIEPGKATIRSVDIKHLPAWFNDGLTKEIKQTEITPQLADALHRGWLASRKSAIATVGFDLSKTVISPKSPAMVSISGFFYPKDDVKWVDMKFESTMIHESLHRGLEVMRRQKILTEKLGSAEEEMLVRVLMQKFFPDLEVQIDEKLVGRKLDNKESQAIRGKELLPKLTRLVDDLENRAAQYLARKRPMGPR
jgi:hypothetical protein